METSVETFDQLFYWAFVAVAALCVMLVLLALGKLLAMFRFRGSLAALVSAGVLGLFLYVLLAHPRADHEDVPSVAAAPVEAPASQMQPVALVPAAEPQAPATAGESPAPPRTAALEAPPRPPPDSVTPPSAPPLQDGVIGKSAADARAEPASLDILFGTDRAVDDAAAPLLRYGAGRGGQLALGRATLERPTPASNRDGEGWRPREIAALAAPTWEKQAADHLARAAMQGHAVVLVPGYRTDFEAALEGAARFADAAGRSATWFVYSWPSGGRVASYSYERDSARGAATHLRQLIEHLVRDGGATTLSFVAQGLGARTLLDALDQLRTSPPSAAHLAEVVLVAPDVDAVRLASRVKDLAATARHVVLYASAADPALDVARRFNGGVPRAGDIPEAGPLVAEGMETIDATRPGTSCFASRKAGADGCGELAGDIARRVAGPFPRADGDGGAIERRTTAAGGAYRRYP